MYLPSLSLDPQSNSATPSRPGYKARYTGSPRPLPTPLRNQGDQDLVWWRHRCEQLCGNQSMKWKYLTKYIFILQCVHYVSVFLFSLFQCYVVGLVQKHDDVIKSKHFPRYWPFVRGIHRSPVNSPYKGQWRDALMFSLICVWINIWTNNREAGDLRRHCAPYDVIVMKIPHLRCIIAWSAAIFLVISSAILNDNIRPMGIIPDHR